MSAKADMIACLAGAAALPLMLFVGLPLRGLIPPSLSATLTLTALSFGSAYLACSRADTSEIPSQSILPSATRLGARVGALVFLIGGGMVLLAGVVRALLLGVPPGDYSWVGPTVSSTSGILLTILPAVASGALGAAASLALAGGIRKPDSEAAQQPPPRPRSVGAAVLAAASTFILCLLSPSLLAVLARRSPEPAVAAEPEAAAPAVAPADATPPPSGPADPQAPAPIPPPPRFSYETPSGLSAAGSGRLRSIASRPIPGLLAGASAGYSHDGKMLAFTVEQGEGLTVRDLADDSEVASFRSVPPIRGFAWSPDASRIFCVCDSPTPFRILDLGGRSAVQLPVRAKGLAASPRWEKAGEVLLFAKDGQCRKLDLDSLRLEAAPGDDREPRSLLPEPSPSTGRCRLSIRPRPESATTPLETGGWGWSPRPALYAVDSHSRRACPVLEEPFRERTEMLVAPDASKVVLLTDEGSRVEYLGVAEEEAGMRQVATLPDLSSELLQLLSSRGELAAFVYAPMVNPLNGRVVGAETSKVRALVFLDSREGDSGTFSVAESYFPIQPGDVAASLHYWDKGAPVLLFGRGLERWWAALSPGKPEPSERQFPIREWGAAQLKWSAAGIEFTGIEQPPAGPDRPTVLPAFEDLEADPAVGAQPEPKDREIPRGRIEAFVRAHHAKVAAHDIDGFVDDYAESVEMPGKGAVTPAHIRKDQADYLPRYDKLSETVVGQVFADRNEAGWTASYTIRSYAVVRRDGSVSDRHVAITLGLRDAGGGFKIVREHAKGAR